MGTLSAIRDDPRLKWAGLALIAIALLALPFVLAMAGTAWVRITNLAILFVLLSLGLNIVELSARGAVRARGLSESEEHSGPAPLAGVGVRAL